MTAISPVYVILTLVVKRGVRGLRSSLDSDGRVYFLCNMSNWRKQVAVRVTGGHAAVAVWIYPCQHLTSESSPMWPDIRRPDWEIAGDWDHVFRSMLIANQSLMS